MVWSGAVRLGRSGALQADRRRGPSSATRAPGARVGRGRRGHEPLAAGRRPHARPPGSGCAAPAVWGRSWPWHPGSRGGSAESMRRSNVARPAGSSRSRSAKLTTTLKGPAWAKAAPKGKVSAAAQVVAVSVFMVSSPSGRTRGGGARASTRRGDANGRSAAGRFLDREPTFSPPGPDFSP